MTRAQPTKQHLKTRLGDIAYLEAGHPQRPPVLFVHGIPTSGHLWRHVLRFLEDDFHCYAPDLMGLGDTVVDLASARFDMEAQAEMLLAFMESLGHASFGLVCHDQGGAAGQLIAARLPHKVEALVLTDCVAYDNWPVPAIARLQRFSRLPLLPDLLGRSGVLEWLERATPLSAFRRGVFQRDRLTAEAIGEYLRPLRGTPSQREAFRRFVLAGHPRHTLAAVDGLRRFDRPTYVIWAADDHYLSPSWGKRLAEDIPGTVGFDLIPFCGHFWPEERPAEFASRIGAFLAAHLGRTAVVAEAEAEAEAEVVPEAAAVAVEG
jgi:pimeloyl-ACP methyl ester carboxylesterase